MIRTKLSLSFTALLFFSLLNFHCTKIDTTSIGSNLIPAVDNVNTFDTTLSVIANNFDSAANACGVVFATDEHALGYISNDPYFGTTKATIYTELLPPYTPFSFQGTIADRTIDSVVLVLKYTRTFGDSTQQQRVTVHQMLDNFKTDTSTCSAYNYDPSILGSATYIPQRLTDSVFGFSEASNNELRIKLSNSFGQQLLAQDSSTSLKTDSTFRLFLKGFAIVPDNTGNALSYFSLTDTTTRLAIYFKYKDASGNRDTAIVNFRLTTGVGYSANNIVRNHTGAEINTYTHHPAGGDSLIYIQTSPGTYAEIQIPALTGLSNRIIYRAELVMDQAYSPLDNLFTTPNILFLDVKGDTSYRPIPCDFTTPSSQPDLTTLGGYRTIVKDAFGHDISRYTFNLSRYVQKIVTNKRTNSVLRLRAPGYINNSALYVDECGISISPFYFPLNYIAMGRVRLGGGNNTNYRMHLRIIYSKI